MRRCAISISSNISEGAARGSTKELIRFLQIAKGSLAKLETQIEIAKRLHCIEKDVAVKNQTTAISKMLYKFTHKLTSKIS